MGSPIIRVSDRAELFLSGCIPDLKFDDLVFALNNLDLEIDPIVLIALNVNLVSISKDP